MNANNKSILNPGRKNLKNTKGPSLPIANTVAKNPATIPARIPEPNFLYVKQQKVSIVIHIRPECPGICIGIRISLDRAIRVPKNVTAMLSLNVKFHKYL